MKRQNNLYNIICDIDVIMKIYDNVIKLNTKNKRKVQKFDNFYSCNIVQIKETLIKKDYIPKKYHIFLIHEPKIRIIMSQNIDDKIINHLVAKYFLIDVFDKTLSDRNCATRIGKGTHYALRLFKKDYNYYLNKFKKFYILKLDISKYFYNLNHKIIMKLVERKIKDKNVLKMIKIILDSTNEEYINEEITRLKNNEKRKISQSNLNEKDKQKRIQEVERIPLYENGKGVCIGNMVSQIVATFYLDEVDKYIQETLKIRAYGRYMDDFYCMSESKEYLKYCLIKIKEMLDKFDLKLNDKTKIYCSTENIEFLGFSFSSKKGNIRMKLVNKTKKKFKAKMKKMNKKYTDGVISYEKYIQVKNSYDGHLSYGNCYRLFNRYVI